MADYTYLGMTLDQWRAAGQAKLAAQRMRALNNGAYYDGEFPLLSLPGASRDIFRRLLREAGTNWCELVVNAVAERLQVIYFNYNDAATNDLAWLIWQDNAMDADSEMAQTDALVNAHSFIGVWPDNEQSSGVRIDIEHAAQVTLFYAPGTRRNPIAAFKSFGSDDGSWGAETPVGSGRIDVLITPDRVETWLPGVDPLAEDNLLGVVPYVEITPAPRTLGPPRSELHSAKTIQDRINTTIYNRMVATDFGAFRQVTATGISLGRNVDGSYQTPFNVGSDRLLASENENARFGVIPESSLTGYLSAVAADVQHLAAITQTPPHYLLGQIVNASGDALKAAETGLVSKVRRRAAHIGEAWEQVMRLALTFVGSVGGSDVQAEVVWRDFETRSEGELVDALVKMRSLDVPLPFLWQRWGVSPQEAATWPTDPPPAPVEPAPTEPVTPTVA
jgi:hypothetical protein